MITVDIPIPQELLAYPRVIRAIVADVADALRNEVVRLANAKLHTSGEDYLQGLQPVKLTLPANGQIPDGTVATLSLTGWLANAVETGWDGGDMKQFLLAGRNAKTDAKGNRYNTVPFRHGTPGSSGRSFMPMGSAYAVRFQLGPGGIQQSGDRTSEAAAALGKRIHKAAKKLSPTTSTPGGGTAWGGRLPEGIEGIAPLLPHHKTDPYAGMVRQTKTYAKATQSTYTTFRRVSENSDPQAWLHPGIEGRHLFREASGYAGTIAGKLIAKALAASGAL